MHRRGEPWQERVGGWLEDSGCDAWVVQREVADLAEYVELWLKDAGVHGRPDYAERYDAWLAWFAEPGHRGRRVRLAAPARVGPRPRPVRLEEWPYEVEQPLGAEVADRAGRTDFAGRHSTTRRCSPAG